MSNAQANTFSTGTTMSIPQIQPLNLEPHQVEHFQRVMGILSRFYFYIDGSEMGTGKTYIAAAAAIMLKLPCIVVCPLGARNTWETVFTTHGVQTYQLPETGGIITYASLRSRKGSQPKHGLLVRDDSGEGVQFYPTTLFSLIVQKGVLLIFDECQNLKNTSDQYKAAKALMRQFYTVGGHSRAALLSGTLMDKEEQAVNLLRMVAFITSRNLYTKIKGRVRLEGVDDLYSWARRIDAEATSKFLADHHFKSTRKGSVEYVFQLFLSVIKPGIMSAMSRPKMNAEKDVKNGYYYLLRNDETEYQRGILDLGHSVHWNERTGNIARSRDNLGAITNALTRLQRAKTGAMIRVAKEILNKSTTDDRGRVLTPKVIMFADYFENVIDRIRHEMAEFNPVELTGRLSEDQRNMNIALFQQPNSNHRLLIGNPLVGGLAVSLHDMTGLFPRTMLIMPGYRINELHQATGRIFRSGTIGVAKIRFFYGLSGSRENSILAALARKGKVMKDVLEEQAKDGVKFPDEYEDEREKIPEGASPITSDVSEHGGLVNPYRPSGDFEISPEEARMIARATEGMNNHNIPVQGQAPN